MAAGHLREELARFGSKFGQSIRPTQISTAAIVARAKHEIIPRIRTSSRSLRPGGARGHASPARGRTREGRDVHADDEPAASTRWASRSRRAARRQRRTGRVRRGDRGGPLPPIPHWAERIVRTEVINAYNVEHIAGVKELNEDLREDGDQPLLLKWDASPDKRICRRAAVSTAASPASASVSRGHHAAAGASELPMCSGRVASVVGRHRRRVRADSAAPGVKMPTPAKSEALAQDRHRGGTEAEGGAGGDRGREEAADGDDVPPEHDGSERRRIAGEQAAFEDSLEHVLGRVYPSRRSATASRCQTGSRRGSRPARSKATARPICRVEAVREGIEQVRRRARPRLRQERGKPYVHHALLEDRAGVPGLEDSDTVNGNAFRHYEKWGVKQIDITAAWVGRYAWARLGFRFKHPNDILSAFSSYINRTPSLTRRRST
jgi:hypothetical protein